MPVAGADTSLTAVFPYLAAISSSPAAAPVGLVEGLPRRLVESYADAACRKATTSEVDPQVWFASVSGLEGAWGEGDSAQEALRDLRETVVGWVAVRRRLGLEIPVLDGLDFNLPPTRPRPA
jgi:predicted RNase H-like HicB family nuclease